MSWDELLRPFEFEFFRNGIYVATIAGALCGFVGCYVVLRNMSYIGHGLSHSIFGGYAVAGLAVPGCGKKGPIQAPLVRTPQAVEGFKAFQRGNAFRLEWTLPPAYIDGTPFTKPVEVEIRQGGVTR